MISDKRFVKAWMTSQTLGEVASKLGMGKQNASAKATTLRRRGVALPTKNPSTELHSSVEELNALVEQYLQEN